MDFFGAQGFSALYYISVRCTRFDVDWAVAGGRDVERLLPIVDPEHLLPLADDFDSACQHLEHLVCRRYPLPGAMPVSTETWATIARDCPVRVERAVPCRTQIAGP
ncbi:MAG: anti-sigma-factor antagonist [Mycobacterium sp.]|nr:anti-sigma-factor antagonist [Mycobacterium sp.]